MSRSKSCSTHRTRGIRPRGPTGHARRCVATVSQREGRVEGGKGGKDVPGRGAAWEKLGAASRDDLPPEDPRPLPACAHSS
eukprot:235351-Chlamydomonas_euryale.AAC.1